MIKISTSKISRNGNYDKQEVIDIIRKGFEAGETEFSVSLMGFGNSNFWEVWKEDYNQEYNRSWDLDIRETALLKVLSELALNQNDPDFGKYIPLDTYEYVIYTLSYIFKFKVRAKALS